MYHLIGDVHGHADELVRLLKALGYRKAQGVYQHPERKAIFLGDFIDRGPKIRQVLEIVRPMIEKGHALAVMGNHELNALAYHTEDPEAPGLYLRPHCSKNEEQHRKTIEQLKHDKLVAYLDWFRTLPLWLDLDGLRVVHACWDDQAVARIAQALAGKRGITGDFLLSACKKGHGLFAPVEIVLKGKEVPLPDGITFLDPDGHPRREIRSRWYLSPRGQTYRTYALQSGEIPCDLELEEAVVAKAAVAKAAPYPTTDKPVFIGHYWLKAQRPEILAENVACLDYSVAKEGGFLCAYRWNGEQKLRNENFVWVTTGHISTTKGELRREAKKGKKKPAAKPKTKVAAPAPPPQAAARPALAAVQLTARNGPAIPLEDILAVRALVDRLGAAPLKTLIDALGR
jgi:hypothetical protein